MQRLSRRMIAGAGAVAALAGGGAAVASTQLAGEADEQAILNDAAERLGVEPAELSEALEQAYLERIDEAVAAGDLTGERAAALKERIQEGDFPLVAPPLLGGPVFHGEGPLLGGLEAVESYLGLSGKEIRDALVDGKTLAELATEQGKTVEGLEQALLEAADERFTAAVEDGRLTEARKDEVLARMKERIAGIVNGELPGPPGPRLRAWPGHLEAPAALTETPQPGLDA